MNLQRYLDRIRFEGTPAVDVATLKQLHRKHLLAISYENLDVQLGRRVDLDINRIYTKMVEQGRGGWCYEMNGLMEWALREIGFDVTRVNGGVMRVDRGDAALGNHLVLLVHHDGTWVADAGFGDGIIEPIPLETGEFEQRGFHYRLQQIDGGYWRLRNHMQGGAMSFDFSTQPADEALFERQCDLLQTSEESTFVTTLLCERFVEDGYDVQLGRVAKHISTAGTTSRLIDSGEELVERLKQDFDLDVPEAASLWPKVVARHEALFAAG
jgi:N-hydroxyarylamine O-acetyltransferase